MNTKIYFLKNEKYSKKIIALYSIKRKMHPMMCFMIEDMKYRLDINNPLQTYDFIWIDDMYRIFYG